MAITPVLTKEYLKSEAAFIEPFRIRDILGSFRRRAGLVRATEQSEAGSKPHQVVGSSDVQEMLDRYQFTTDARRIVEAEKLLPVSVMYVKNNFQA